MSRQVFILSDGTGITAEAFSSSLISQFSNTTFEKVSIPYIDSTDKANNVVLRINEINTKTQNKPLVFTTLVNPEIRTIINQADACIFDLFSTFIGPLEQELNEKSSYTVGKMHGVADYRAYLNRIEAIDFALTHDDGIKTKSYDKADIILIGVSRCGKTPSCLYIALQFGLLAANYPFTDDDLNNFKLPEVLKPYKKKLFGLTIDAERLEQIRSERRPNSQYSSKSQCRLEVSEVEYMYKFEGIPYLNSTKFSIEEIATKILSVSGLKKKV